MSAAGRSVLTPRADGTVAAASLVRFPVMAPRLQAEVGPGGRLELALWGAGSLGVLNFDGLEGPCVFAPNRITSAGGGLHVAQSAPVLLLKGATYRRFTPARRCAWWDRQCERAPVQALGAVRRVALDWGVVLIEAREGDLLVAAGASEAEARGGLSLTAQAIIAEADAYVRQCDAMPEADRVLRSLVMQGVHAALSSRRRDESGAFAGLAAGLAYSAPARTYYRDGYWTMQALLRLDPAAVRDEIDLLALAVRPDGQAPSGVIVSGPAQSAAWEAVRKRRAAHVHQQASDWWSDHFDSPLFFVLAVGDYVRASGDADVARRHWPLIQAVFQRYVSMQAPGAPLPVKPRNDRDWADNVYRQGFVAYDIGLWVGALAAIARLGETIDPPLAGRAAAARIAALGSLDRALLRPEGWYADFAAPDGFTEDHLSLDSLTLLAFDAVGDDRARTVLAAARARLETRNNPDQRWGDWGVMCAWPPFKRRSDVRAKSAFAYRYHNGGDWPWLDGLCARERLRRGLGGSRYPLTRWWETCLANGWMGAVEHFSPPFGRGSLLQAWSSLPAAVALEYKGVVLREAGDDD